MSAAAQQFFTARELADATAARGLAGLPMTERGWRKSATREGWNALPERLARPRATSGTGGRPTTEYHLSLLPEALQAALTARTATVALQAAHEIQTEAARRQVMAIRAQALGAHARGVMEARAEILTTIEGYAIAHGENRAWGIASFVNAQKAFADRQEIELRRESGAPLSPHELASLSRPLELTSPTGFHIAPERLRVANDRRNAMSVSRRALYDWFKVRDERGVVALAPVPPKEAEPIPAAFAEFLKFYAMPSKPTISDAHAQYLKKVTGDPGLHHMPITLGQARRILRERMNNIEKHVGREGLLTLRSRMAYVTRTTEGMWPTTIYTADGKTFDAEIADPVTKNPIRPEITTILDVVTRKVVGISLARSENQRTVAEALRNSCVDNGIPAIFYVDRGPGYKNEAMDADVSGLMGRLGITKMHALPYGSQAKGRIERPQATIWDVLAKRLPTYISRDMDKEAKQFVHKKTRREIAEFGESRLLPSWERFVELAWGMVAEYNDRPHRGLPKFIDPETGKTRHMSPNEAWAAHVRDGFHPVQVDADEVDDLFRPYETRVARRGEVQWNSNTYFDHALVPYHQKKVMVGYDYHQADRVWVREFDVETGQPGKLICVARFEANAQRYVPVSYEQKAIEDRAKSRQARIGKKSAEIEAERLGLHLVEHQPVEPAPFFESIEDEPVRISQEPEVPDVPASLPRRRTFASDEDLAAWALDHPEELTPNQINVLKSCLGSQTARDLFRMSGIDVEALRTLLRAVA
ncbi:Mu transposase C-terminal domain-containing protein [Acidimangrovimonas sediminis]|uniref:Mu transposase C-terminal domain-containing protein n=1 Tax=Acidimangrovimonas sediminis TaxID=2056283 RepID=UPI000C8033E7|nr:Mu transposase C-terminal domain-containing protein [Acidimangrovimonas sediminis]